MITEDYVSFETAKLLKEKGFDEYCLKNYWSTDKELHNWGWELSYHRNSDGNRNTKDCVAPTLQMAMKWLREVHKIFIDVDFDTIEFGDEPYYTIITNMSTHSYITGRPAVGYKTYEEAAESAIEYCLENLI